MPACRFRASLIVWAILLVLGAWPGLVASALAQDEQVLLLFVFDRPPYYALERGQPAGGMVLDIALEVFKRAGIPVEVREMPPSRILANFESRDIAGCAVGWLRIPEREKFARFSLPLYVDKPLGVVMYPEKAREFGPSPSLKTLLAADLTWGARQGFSYGMALDATLRQLPTGHVSFFSDTGAMLRLVAQHRLDVMPISPEELSAYLDAEPGLEHALRFLPLADASPDFSRHIMCDRSVDQAVMARLDAAIRAFRDTDQYRLLTRLRTSPERVARDAH